MGAKNKIKKLYVKAFFKLFNENSQLINHLYKKLKTHQSDYV